MDTMMRGSDIALLSDFFAKEIDGHRPSGQTFGYSGEDTEANAPGSTCAVSGLSAASPAALPLPAVAVDKQLGLPVPSAVTERAKQQSTLKKTAKRLEKDQIWNDEEINVMRSEFLRTSGLRCAAAPPLLSSAKASSPSETESGADVRRGREEPEHKVLLLQRVGAEDVYLGVDATRDNSSAGSDGVVVKVELPKHTGGASAIAMDVQPFVLIVQCEQYYLRAPLPQKVQSRGTRAQWDPIQHLLTITMQADSVEQEKRVKIL